MVQHQMKGLHSFIMKSPTAVFTCNHKAVEESLGCGPTFSKKVNAGP